MENGESEGFDIRHKFQSEGFEEPEGFDIYNLKFEGFEESGGLDTYTMSNLKNLHYPKDLTYNDLKNLHFP